ncbi:MAG: SIS domain-containing protein [Candidatus Brocadia sp.]|nr:SIS domain-containing protein [Candidatus Brocadia sp.]
MQEFAKNYYKNLFGFISSTRVTSKSSEKLTFPQGIEMTCNLITSQAASGYKTIFIGNGGSAAISSHMAIDFWKNGGMKAISFNDGPLLTCIGNDYGYQHVFGKPIEMFADAGDILVAISSSGKSENILLGVQAARTKNCKVVTLSGFDENNPLSSLGEFNFYVPSKSYGVVEVIHHSICHCIIDTIMSVRGK